MWGIGEREIWPISFQTSSVSAWSVTGSIIISYSIVRLRKDPKQYRNDSLRQAAECGIVSRTKSQGIEGIDKRLFVFY